MRPSLGLFVLLVVLATPAVHGQSESAGLVIAGDADFDAAHGVSSGNGTADNPYIIDELRGRSRLELRDTTAHVVVRDLKLGTGSFQWFGDAILVQSAANVTVEDVSVTSFQYGVHAVDSEDLVVRGSTFMEQVFHGVFVERGSGIRIEDSTFERTQTGGIVSRGTRDLGITNNTFDHAGRTSGRISSSVLVVEGRGVDVSYNTIDAGASSGIFLEVVEDYHVDGNEIRDAAGHGIWLDTSSLGTANRNRVTGSGSTGLYFCTEGAAVAEGNILVGNNLGMDLAHASGVVLTNNTVEGSLLKGLVLRAADGNHILSNRFLDHEAALPVVEVAGNGNVFTNNTIEGNAGPAYWLVEGEGNLFDGQNLTAQGEFPEPQEPAGRDGPASPAWAVVLLVALLAIVRRRRAA
jgi:parallel beta-helix repeat protein